MLLDVIGQQSTREDIVGFIKSRSTVVSNGFATVTYTAATSIYY
jgi:hypothetical protein